MGLNVSLTEAELPVPHAISLTIAGAENTDRTQLVQSMLTEFARRFTAWRDAGWQTTDLAVLPLHRHGVASHRRPAPPGPHG